MAISLKDYTYATFLRIDFGESTGSGFRVILESKEFLITAKHVVYEITYNNLGVITKETLKGDILLTSMNYDGAVPFAYSANVNLANSKILTFPEKDIVLIELVEGVNYDITEKGLDISPVNAADLDIFANIEIASNVYIVGFPSSLVDPKDFEVERPLLRHGIVAGINSKNNTFIIDSPAFYGNSGGPVLQRNEKGIFIIGLVSRYIPFVTDWFNSREQNYTRQEFYNSGYAICEPLDDIINYLYKK